MKPHKECVILEKWIIAVKISTQIYQFFSFSQESLTLFKYKVVTLYTVTTLYVMRLKNIIPLTLASAAVTASATQPIVVPLSDTSTEGEPPFMTVYVAPEPSGVGVIMCPGGGYSIVAADHEGHDMAPWFNERGITYVVLNYRIPNGDPTIPLSDAQRAITEVRSHAQEWGVDPCRVGIMGASAGGHLAATLANIPTDTLNRPNFQILLYPVISFREDTGHMGSRRGLIGENPSEELVARFSLDEQVTSATPPAFIVLSSDDPGVKPANSLRYFQALVSNGISAELHAYPTGGHGWGFRESFPYHDQWLYEMGLWLERMRDNAIKE